MVTRRIAVITLRQTEGSLDTETELDRQIRQVISSSLLSNSWKIEHIAFLDDNVKMDQENVEA